jgi:hypothetical protein
LAFSPEVQNAISEITAAREEGLIRLLHQLESNKLAPNVQAIIRQWIIYNRRLRSIRAVLQDRLIRRRRWLYRNVAAFLTKTYMIIGLEDEFAAKDMIEDRESKDLDLPFRRSIKYYQWAAVAELRSYILEAAAKNGTRIAEVKTRWSTTTCSICGQYTPHQPSLELRCPNGHVWDQDVNAASNILAWINDFDQGVQTGANHQGNIPNILTKIIVPIRTGTKRSKEIQRDLWFALNDG